jgi:hypothetical protein
LKCEKKSFSSIEHEDLNEIHAKYN